MPDWGTTFDITLPIGELIARGSVIFLVVLLLMRLVGQREAGGLGITDVLLVVLVAEATAPGLHGGGTTIGDSLVVVVSILFWSVAVDAAAYRWPRVSRILKARPKVLVRNGVPNPKVMRREFMTDEEITSILRLEGIEDRHVVKIAYIEPNGMVSVLRHDGEETKAPHPSTTL